MKETNTKSGDRQGKSALPIVAASPPVPGSVSVSAVEPALEPALAPVSAAEPVPGSGLVSVSAAESAPWPALASVSELTPVYVSETASQSDAGNTDIRRRRRGSHRKRGKIPGQGKKKDSATSVLFRDSSSFAEVFNRTLFAGIPVKAEDLSVEDTKESALLRVTKDTHTTLTQYRDVVKTLSHGQPLAILGIENQSESNYQMPFRVFEFDFVNYARQIQEISERHEKERKEKRGMTAEQREGTGTAFDLQMRSASDQTAAGTPGGSLSCAEYLSRFNREDRIMPCITLVIYWGTELWQGPRRLSDMFVESPWAAIASDYEMHLLEVNRMTDEQIRAYGPKLRAVFGFVKYAGDKEGLQGFIEENRDEFADLPGTVIAAIAELTHSPELKRIPADDFESEVTYDMCQALTEMMEDSKKEGIEEGIREGKKEGRKEGIKEGIKEEQANTERERQRADTAERLVREMQAEIMRLKVQLQYATGQGR